MVYLRTPLSRPSVRMVHLRTPPNHQVPERCGHDHCGTVTCSDGVLGFDSAASSQSIRRTMSNRVRRLEEVQSQLGLIRAAESYGSALSFCIASYLLQISRICTGRKNAQHNEQG